MMNDVYLNDDVDIEELCKSFIKDESTGCYKLESTLGEYIIVNSNDRSIVECGYDGLLYSWADLGYIKGWTTKSDKEELAFPHTIGNITFYTKQELIDWCMEIQKEIGLL